MDFLKNYAHGGDIYGYAAGSVLDFSANINPFGLPNGVKQAIIDHMSDYTAYPDPHCRRLKSALSQHTGYAMEQIACGNGAADLIFKLALAFRPKVALLPAPTFGEYQAGLSLVDCQIRRHNLSRDQGFVLDQSFVSAVTEEVDMVFVCNPNNPTGLLCDKNLLLALAKRCEQVGAKLVVDECFLGFLETEKAETLAHSGFKNVILLKAFTKLYAMAGLRLGYALCGQARDAAALENTLQPWSVSTVAQIAGIAALKETSYVEDSLAYLSQERGQLKKGLQGLGLQVYEGKANYLFFTSRITNLEEKTAKMGVLIRACHNFYGLDRGDYRVAVKKKEENETLLRVLARCLEG